MDILHTSHYLKDYSKITDQKVLKDIKKIEERIASVDKFTDLFNLLDIKKYDPGLGGYRIRFGGRPEWRIRFDIVDNPIDKSKKIIELQIVLPREKYEKYAHRSITESVENKLIIVLTEAQLEMIKNIKQNTI